MTPTASPTNKRSTHHVVLTQDDTSVGLILCNRSGEAEPRAFNRNPIDQSALKIATGAQKYADLSGNWKYVEQKDWSGGKGSKDFDKALDMYYDSYQIDTRRPGEVILGPKPTRIALGSLVEMTNTPGTGYGVEVANYDGTPVSGSSEQYHAHKFTASETINVSDITVTLKRTYNILGSLNVGIGTISGGDPSSITYSNNSVSLINVSESGQAFLFTFSSPIALTSGTDYFLVFRTTNITFTEYFNGTITALNSTTVGSSHKYKVDSGAWVADTYPYVPYFYMSNAAVKRNRAHMFEYKGAMYYVMQNDDGTSSKLYLNGDHGFVESGATTSEITITGVATWAENEAIGCILKIIKGTGSNQVQIDRMITGNSATSSSETTFTFDDAFDVAPAALDVVAIVASDKFTEITEFDTLYNVVVTDVLSVNGVVYFACGDSTVIKRMVAIPSGIWAYSFSEDSGQDPETGAFTFLEYSAGKIWGAKGGYPATVAYATAVDYTGFIGTETVLSFSSPMAVGDQYERITGLERYGEIWTGLLMVLKEGSWHRYREGQWEELDIREMGNAKDRRNGLAHCVHGTYLYASWHNSVVRYYNGLLDSVGPDKAEVAIPTESRHGHFSALFGVPGYVIGSIDAGINGVSSVVAYNERGWCELYRGTLGARIQNVYVQSIPGNAVDRLWIAEGATLIWLPLSIDPFNHPADTYNGYRFCTEGTLITAWYYVDLVEISKLFYAVRFITEGTGTDEKIILAYRLDDDETWTDVSGEIDSFSEELKLATTPSVVGKRIQFKLTLTSADGMATPRLLGMVMECMPRIPVKHYEDITFRVADNDKDLLGKADSYTTYTDKINALDAMEQSAAPVLVTSVATAIHDHYAWVEGVTLSPDKITVATGEEVYIGRARLVEIET